MCQSEGTHQIVMSFSPLVVGCLLKEGGRGSWAPQDPPPLTLDTPLKLTFTAFSSPLN